MRNWQEVSCLFATKVVLDLDPETPSNKTLPSKMHLHTNIYVRISGGSRTPQTPSTDPQGVHEPQVVSYYTVNIQVALISPLHLFFF